MIRLIQWLICLGVMLAVTPAHAQDFPPLSGRVVDQADLLRPEQEVDLTAKLAALEQQTGRQFVVATVNSLGEQEIADYSTALGRHWQIGDEKEDDGVVMVVAPNERKVWIATGYGAEGYLPDILIGRIVRNTILPRFKAGDMGGGIVAGADAVIAQLQLSPEEAQQRVEKIRASERESRDDVNPLPVVFIVIIFFVIIGSIAKAAGGRRYRSRGGKRRGGLDSGDIAVILWGLSALSNASRGGGGSSWGGGGGGGWGGGGGFSGGGGSFGGGGAGGSW